MSDPGWESSRPAAPAAGGRGGRLRTVGALVVGLVVVATGVRALGPGADEPSTGELQVEQVTETPAPRTLRTPPPQPAPARDPDEAAGTWTAGMRAPVPARGGSAVVWTGREVLVIGGTAPTDVGVSIDLAAQGAAYDPAADTWRDLPPFPLDPRRSPAWAWTGRELILWGGVGREGLVADGAAYDPAADTWRVLPPAPLSARGEAGAVWTGTEALVLGGGDLTAGLADGAAYDPAADTWRRLATAPRTSHRPAGVVFGDQRPAVAWTGDRAVVVPPPSPFAGEDGVLLAYDPAADAWSQLPPLGTAVQVLAVAGTGDDLSAVVLDYLTGGSEVLLHRLAPDGAWSRADDGPVVGDAAPVVVGGGRLWLAEGPDAAGDVVAVDLADGTWQALPDRTGPSGVPPGAFSLGAGALVWTGAELVVLHGWAPGLLDVSRWRPAATRDELAGLVPDGTDLGLRRWFYESTGGTAPAP